MALVIVKYLILKQWTLAVYTQMQGDHRIPFFSYDILLGLADK